MSLRNKISKLLQCIRKHRIAKDSFNTVQRFNKSQDDSLQRLLSEYTFRNYLLIII